MTDGVSLETGTGLCPGLTLAPGCTRRLKAAQEALGVTAVTQSARGPSGPCAGLGVAVGRHREWESGDVWMEGRREDVGDFHSICWRRGWKERLQGSMLSGPPSLWLHLSPQSPGSLDPATLISY